MRIQEHYSITEYNAAFDENNRLYDTRSLRVGVSIIAIQNFALTNSRLVALNSLWRWRTIKFTSFIIRQDSILFTYSPI